MTIMTNLRGTSENQFRISLTGPTLYQGTADPTVTPPTPIDSFKSGDIYIRNNATGGLYQYNGTNWIMLFRSADNNTVTGNTTFSGTSTFDGNVTMNDPVDVNALLTVDNLNMTGPIQAADGTGTIPSISFFNSPGMGFYLHGTNELGISTSGVARWYFATNGDLIPTTNGVANIGSVASNLNEIYALSLSSLYGDVAERYYGNPDLPAGTVMVISSATHLYEVVPCERGADSRVIGVVSDSPSVKMNDRDPTWPFVALRGRVPVNVIGKVRVGDLLVTSSVSGTARSATWWEKILFPHAVFAKVIHVWSQQTVEAVIL